MPTKPNKYRLMYWLAVHVESRHLLNGFPYLGNDEYRPDNRRVPDYVVMHLIQPYLNKGIHITADNYFTCLQLAKKLKEKYISIAGIVKYRNPSVCELNSIHPSYGATARVGPWHPHILEIS
jgi:hypothetical protein